MNNRTWLALICLAGCASNDGPLFAVDAGSELDAAAMDANAPTDANAADLATDDASLSDFGSDALSIDAGDDAGTVDGGIGDSGNLVDSGCYYLETPFVVRCDDELTVGFYWINAAGTDPACPVYYTLSGNTSSDIVDVINASSCDPDCIYQASMSVSLIFCGHRFGYETYAAGSDEVMCPEFIDVGGSFYADFEEYRATHPCPDAGGPSLSDGGMIFIPDPEE